MSDVTRDRPDPNDEGLGLIEIVVAMLMLAILAVSFLPVLIQGLQTAAVNSTRATAAQFAHEQMEIARAQQDDCSAIQDLAAVVVSNRVDPRNVTLVTDPVAGTCPSSYPGVLKYTVTVTRLDTGAILASAETYVFVANG